MSYRKLRNVLGLSAVLAMGGCGLEQSEDLVQADQQAIASEASGYIVVFKDGTPAQARASELASAHGVAIGHVYRHALQGFSFQGSATAAAKIAQRADVAYVEPNGMAYIVDGDVSTSARPGDGGGGGQVVPWGVARVGGASDGTGKTAWVIDTGIDLDHADLNVDVSRSANFVAKGKNSADDGNGHGTHVAGTIGALDNGIDVVGVAAGATVVAVRVLDNSGSGTIDGVIAGVDYVAANAASGDAANMSLGASGHFQALHDAVDNAASNGINFAIAAGNEGAHASNSEPAHVEHNNVYTVSAIDEADCLTYWSNYGNPPVDVAAPGNGILSTKKGGGTTTMSGTSMASPHVAGLLLLGSVRSDGSACADPDGNSDPIAHN